MFSMEMQITLDVLYINIIPDTPYLFWYIVFVFSASITVAVFWLHYDFSALSLALIHVVLLPFYTYLCKVYWC